MASPSRSSTASRRPSIRTRARRRLASGCHTVRSTTTVGGGGRAGRIRGLRGGRGTTATAGTSVGARPATRLFRGLRAAGGGGGAAVLGARDPRRAGAGRVTTSDAADAERSAAGDGEAGFDAAAGVGSAATVGGAEATGAGARTGEGADGCVGRLGPGPPAAAATRCRPCTEGCVRGSVGPTWRARATAGEAAPAVEAGAGDRLVCAAGCEVERDAGTSLRSTCDAATSGSAGPSERGVQIHSRASTAAPAAAPPAQIAPRRRATPGSKGSPGRASAGSPGAAPAQRSTPSPPRAVCESATERCSPGSAAGLERSPAAAGASPLLSLSSFSSAFRIVLTRFLPRGRGPARARHSLAAPDRAGSWSQGLPCRPR